MGEYLTWYAYPKATVMDGQERGKGILSKIRAILEDIPLGKRRLDIGITVREAWALYNSEFWCSYSENDLKALGL